MQLSYNGLFPSGLFEIASGKVMLNRNILPDYKFPNAMQEKILNSANELYSVLKQKQVISYDSINKINAEIRPKFKNYFNDILEACDFYKVEYLDTNNQAENKSLIEMEDESSIELTDLEEESLANMIQGLSEAGMFAIANRGFFDNLTMNLPRDFNEKDISVEELLTDEKYAEFTSIERVTKPENAKTRHGMVSEVYFAGDNVIKPGKLYINNPERRSPYDIELNQNIDMGNLPASAGDGKDYLVDSAFRQVGQNIVADELGFDCIVPTKLGIDNINGYVAIMDSAKGKPGKDFVLYENDNNSDVVKNVELYKAKNPETYIDLLKITPELQQSAIELSIVDFICAQEDRHAGNFFVDKATGKISGIDNDCCFCLNDNGDSGYLPKIKNKDVINNLLRHKIPCITPELKQKVLNLNTDILVEKLTGKIDRGLSADKVIESLRERIDILKDYVQNACPCFDKFGKDTYNTFYKYSYIIDPRFDNPIACMHEATKLNLDEVSNQMQQTNLKLINKLCGNKRINPLQKVKNQNNKDMNEHGNGEI